MQTDDRPSLIQETSPQQIKKAIQVSQEYLMSLQYPDGYWWSELESNVTITAEVVILHKIWGTDKDRPLEKAQAYLRQQQRDHGGWELYYGDGGEISTSVEAYMALRVLGVPADDPQLLKSKDFILSKGGISKTRIFTKLHLALIGCYDWRGTPSIPPWIMLLPEWFPFTIYEMSSWARSSTVPLIAVCDQKPIYDLGSEITLDELYAEGIENVKYELPRNHNWADIFVGLDSFFKWLEKSNLVPWRKTGLKAAEKWILERQEVSGDWGGIIPAMLNSMLALKVLGYDVNDPFVQRGFAALDNFAIETENTYCIQACVSPVWDTAWVVRALVDSGIKPDHPALVRAGEWLIKKQILTYGDWYVKNKLGKPGGWAFEFDNNFYPDLDDSAVVVMALAGLDLPDEGVKKATMQRGVEWMATMQCKAGGWAAFDIDNDQDWLNDLPYGDLRAMIDPNTADVTARVLEMLGSCHLSMEPERIERALAYLEKEQESDGSWFGRWGVNYLYGTSGVISALAVIDPVRYQDRLTKAIAWIESCQNPDGGWGETCESYKDSSLKGQGISTASQTAWALIGLLDGGNATGLFSQAAIADGINYLISTQKSDGSWDETEFTGTGFPCHFYIRYHMYRQYFPLIALVRYERLLTDTKGV
jgi:squalene-hopene/tetraprenyl-beta-curcumene cyclase